MSLDKLIPYLPDRSFPYFEKIINEHSILIIVTNPKKTRLGSFKASSRKGRHEVRVTGSLNPYSFAITLAHEIAHVKTFEKYGRKADPHGLEWKNFFIKLMLPLLEQKIFPSDIESVLVHHLKNPKASSSTDPRLVMVLKKYDKVERQLPYLGELEEGSLFEWVNGMVFRKGELRRTRFKCKEIKTGRYYLFNKLAEVKPVMDANSKSLANPVLKEKLNEDFKLYKIAEIEDGCLFERENGMIFKKGSLLRTRYLCKEVKTGKEYSFHHLAEVRLVRT